MRLFEALDVLDRLKRTGWILCGIPHSVAESVTSHTLKVVYISLLLSSILRRRGVKDVDTEKVLRTALIHDLPEAVTSDIPRGVKRRFPPEFSRKLNEIDSRIVAELLSGMDEQLKAELLEALDEYLEARSLESRIVHAADCLATCLQGLFYTEVMGISTKPLKQLVEEVKKETTRELESLEIDVNQVVRALLGDEFRPSNRWGEK